MGRWGLELFQGDDDLDHIIDISAELGVEDLFLAEDPEAISKLLNDGRLSAKLDAHIVNAAKPIESPPWPGYETSEKTVFVLTIAGAMMVGAHIEKRHMKQLKRWYRNTEGIYEEGQAQIKQALKGYPNNGKPYDMAGPGLLATVNIKYAKKQVKRWMRTKTKMESLPRCWWCGIDQTEGEPLMKCASCRIAVYCNKDCQTSDWQLHKPECKGATQVNKDGEKRFILTLPHDVV